MTRAHSIASLLIPLFVLTGTFPLDAASAAWPWKLGQEFRYIWLKGRQRVGETRLAMVSVPHPGRPREKIVEIQATRDYDHAGMRQKAFGTTHLKTDGTALRFHERLSASLSSQEGKGALQETRFENREQTAWITYVHNGKEDRPIVRKHDFPNGTFLLGNQAIEHWLMLVAGLPKEFEKHTLAVYYPDHRRTFAVEFKKKKTVRRLKLGGRFVDATLYSFSSPDSVLSGKVWIKDRRLLQLEFKAADLKIVLGKSTPIEPKK